MKKILITGNGFDIAHGLPTNYANFIDIVSIIQDKTSDDLKGILVEIVNKGIIKKERFNNSYDALLKDEYLKNRIIEIENISKDNIWFKFFKEEKGIDTWIDFEMKIKYVVDNLYKFIGAIDSLHDGIRGEIIDNNLRVYNLMNKYLNLNNITKNILDYFEISKSDDHGNCELFNKDFFIENNKLYFINVSGIIKYLIEPLNEFKNLFTLYLDTFIHIIKVDKILIKYKKITNHFIFNYTRTFDLLYNKAITKYLHGTISNKERDIQNNIVLGFDDFDNKLKKITQYKGFHRFTKYFQKLDQDTDYRFLKEIDLKEGYPCDIYIYGHSLDVSDKDYINEIFDFIERNKLEKYNSNVRMYVFYHDEASKSDLLINLIDIIGRERIELYLKESNLVFKHTECFDEILEKSIRKPYGLIKTRSKVIQPKG